MAKKNPKAEDQQTETSSEEKTQTEETVLKEETVSEEETQTEEVDDKGCVKVIMTKDYFGTYGVFKVNDVIELSSKVANNFIENKIAKEKKD